MSLLGALAQQVMSARPASAAARPINQGAPVRPNSRRQRVLSLIETGERVFTVDEVAKAINEPCGATSHAMSELRVEGYLRIAGVTTVGRKLFCAIDHELTEEDRARTHQDTGERIIEILKDGSRRPTSFIAKELGFRDQTARRWLAELHERGEIDFEEDRSRRRRLWGLVK